MRYLIHAAIVLLLVLQGWQAGKLTVFELQFQAGRQAFRALDAKRALQLFDRALETDSSDSQIWAWKADAAVYLHDYSDSLGAEQSGEELLEQAWAGYAGSIRRNPVDAWSWSGLADVSLKEKAILEERKGLDLARLEDRARGVLDWRQQLALAAATLAVELKPTGYEELDVLAAVYESIGDLENARRTYVESARMMPAATFHVWSAGRPMPDTLFDAIVQGLSEGVERAPSFERSSLHLEIGKFAFAQGRPETAVEHLATAREEALEPYQEYNALWELSRVFESEKQFEEALEALVRAEETIPGRNPLSRNIGSLQLRVGNVEEACANLRDAVRREPADDGLRVQASRACEQAGEPDMAARILSEGFVVPTDNLVLARVLLDFYRRQGRDLQADHLLRTWARDFPENEELQSWAEAANVTEP